ncbi:4'-phosphopantetheinyl transferase superfamily protein [Micromonospora sp. HM5-17]|uniref:4'-phosphopantetheinyl transferase family protein n=1 Tax=Micromonospora sp. HM5-17 TaxID=2487710 RepID=UPI0018F63DB0|nr:4'-phosphopantetheinyl transferase superfamily protein [Micromonospora sp. HM5-17]
MTQPGRPAVEPPAAPPSGTPPAAGAAPTTPAPPVPGECQVWRLPLGAGHWAGLDVLDPTERERHARFLRAADRDRYQAAHLGVRLLLGHYLGVPPAELRFSRRCRHCGAGHGKPTVAHPATKLDFSLTHSGDWVALAVAAAPVGLDVQEIGDSTDLAILSATVLAPAELRWWREQPPARARRAFFRYWARKEALLKATGYGLAVPMNAITVSPPDEPARLLDWSAHRSLDGPVQLYDLDTGPDYTGAVAVLSSLPVRITQAPLPLGAVRSALSGG